MITALLLATAALLALPPLPAHAHERSVSYIDLATTPNTGDARLQLNVRRLDLSRLAAAGPPDLGPLSLGAPLDDNARAALAGLVELRSDAGRCSIAALTAHVTTTARATFTLQMTCPGQPTELRLHAIWAVPGHLAVLTYRDDAREAPYRQVLTALEPVARWSRPPPRAPALLGGALHILSGYDHVAFVLLLLLGVRRLRDAALIVTGFTLGHSLTLSLMALGWVEVDGRAVEAVIAFSVLALAAENARTLRHDAGGDTLLEESGAPALAGALGLLTDTPALLGAGLLSASGMGLLRQGVSPERVRQGLASLFGMAHGLGFAGALTHTGEAPPLGLLVTWNVGVELGQLAIVLAAWPALMALEARGHGSAARTLGVGAGAFVGALALAQALA